MAKRNKHIVIIEHDGSQNGYAVSIMLWMLLEVATTKYVKAIGLTSKIIENENGSLTFSGVLIKDKDATDLRGIQNVIKCNQHSKLEDLYLELLTKKKSWFTKKFSSISDNIYFFHKLNGRLWYQELFQEIAARLVKLETIIHREIGKSNFISKYILGLTSMPIYNDKLHLYTADQQPDSVVKELFLKILTELMMKHMDKLNLLDQNNLLAMYWFKQEEDVDAWLLTNLVLSNLKTDTFIVQNREGEQELLNAEVGLFTLKLNYDQGIYNWLHTYIEKIIRIHITKEKKPIILCYQYFDQDDPVYAKPNIFLTKEDEKRLSPSSYASLGEQLIESYLTTEGYEVEKTKTTSQNLF